MIEITDTTSTPAATPPYHPRRVTIIDDEAGLRDTLAEMLADAGWQVTALAGATDLSAINAARPDLLIVDQLLGPDSLRGEEIIALARQHPELGDVPMVLCSALVSGYFEPEASVCNAIELPKPFSAADLEAAISAACSDVLC